MTKAMLVLAVTGDSDGTRGPRDAGPVPTADVLPLQIRAELTSALAPYPLSADDVVALIATAVPPGEVA